MFRVDNLSSTNKVRKRKIDFDVQWEQSNHLRMMYIKSILVNQFGFHPNCYKVKDNCKTTKDQIVKSDEVLAFTLIKEAFKNKVQQF